MMIRCVYLPNLTCIQSCGCCKDCQRANECKYSSPECACGIWRNHRFDTPKPVGEVTEVPVVDTQDDLPELEIEIEVDENMKGEDDW